MKKILSVLAILMILSLLTVIPAGAEDPAQAPYTARPSVNGRLQVTDSRLADESGNPVILRGISTHGLTWFPQYIDPFIFDQISEDWNCNLIRLAMYSELYCGSQKEESLELLKKGIDAATEADMYVLVDWHILNDSDPNEHINEALGFFREIASEYADHPNLIFEICNEPNGDTNWSDVRSYARQVIPAIREFIPDAVVVVGTPEYDQNLSAPILRPLDFNNVLYCLHFYAASHDKGLQEELRLAVEAKLPVFVSECGISESSGDGAIDFDSAASWFSYLESHGISFAVWSLCDKTESSAIFKHGFDVTQPITDADLSVAGTWVRELIRGKDPASIPAPAGRLDAAEVKDIVTWFTNSLEFRSMSTLRFWLLFAAGAVLLVLLAALGIIIAIKRRRNISRTYDQYYQKINALQASGSGAARNKVSGTFAGHAILIASIIATLIYLSWRVGFSLPLKSGVLAIASSGILLIVEVLGFIESLVLFLHMIHMKDHPLPAIPKDRYPDVDIFISTYNEPEDLLRRTINGCRHMEYPDLSKVHIWVCDDNHRPSMRALAEEMGVGYFDREDHNGAKAGNLNHAMSLTSAPYIVTFDADMIPKSDFLLKTIPYFVDIEIRNESLPPEERRHLGLLQTPQCFYDPDVFQHALYSEKRVPNEQDFFYRTIEPAKTSTNSVIYGGSNTVLSRKALEDTGGFFTESITEDFATGLLIESKGYLSLAIPEPLASGQTPPYLPGTYQAADPLGQRRYRNRKKAEDLPAPRPVPSAEDQLLEFCDLLVLSVQEPDLSDRPADLRRVCHPGILLQLAGAPGILAADVYPAGYQPQDQQPEKDFP